MCAGFGLVSVGWDVMIVDEFGNLRDLDYGTPWKINILESLRSLIIGN